MDRTGGIALELVLARSRLKIHLHMAGYRCRRSELALPLMFETQALVLSFPKLPMLIPCPGPQLTLCTYTFEHPVCMEIQSSPAPQLKLKTSLNQLELCML